MGCHESDSWHVDVGMLSWLEPPWSCHLDGDSTGVSWKGLYQGLAASLTEVTVHEGENSPGTLGDPDRNGSIEESDLGKIGERKMVVDDDDDQDDQGDV